jgi:hypothetical protein
MTVKIPKAQFCVPTYCNLVRNYGLNIQIFSEGGNENSYRNFGNHLQAFTGRDPKIYIFIDVEGLKML